MGLHPFVQKHDICALCLRQRLACGPVRFAGGLVPRKSKGRNQYVTIGDKNIFSSNLINDVRFSFTRTNMRAFVTEKTRRCNSSAFTEKIGRTAP